MDKRILLVAPFLIFLFWPDNQGTTRSFKKIEPHNSIQQPDTQKYINRFNSLLKEIQEENDIIHRQQDSLKAIK